MKQDPAKAAKARALVAALLIFESAVIALLGVWLIILTINADSVEIRPLLGELIFIALGSGGLFAAAAGYRRGKYFGRAPAFLANLIAIGVSKYQFDAGLYIVAIPLFILAVITVVSVLRAIPDRLPTS
ncbi:MAG: hypothetical protein EBW12_06120 [Actinobacteria bacterium]|jgi:hypothetical protein|nr:hypothetical protein [Actinomycetota bacterium]NCV41566.1 hypothetical protein [Actinomycetota bacterium]NCV82266.1 hypothetical protein [Actinomycetota bacterium]NCW43648.1 hypothetical protein [Actinomycetota bacterium]NCW72565.1 hypothetical protein [Actinomycetota bacterium]